MDDEFLRFQAPPRHYDAGKSPSAVCGGADDAYLNGAFADVSFRSLLTYCSPPNPVYQTIPPDVSKTELLCSGNGSVSAQAPPLNFFADSASSSSSTLPLGLPQKRAVTFSPNESHFPAKMMPYHHQKRRKLLPPQQKLSDKTRSLQKLLPWDEKMDIATVLESAYEYIRFLQAQVRALQSMPSLACSSSPASYGTTILGNLNQQQLLQVVINSESAQSHLYSTGCCVYSIDQLLQSMED